MPKKEAQSGTDAVLDFIKSTKHPLKKEIEALRKIVLGAGTPLEERIKWNAPSFCFQGEDKITFNLSSAEKVQLVFHRGAKVKEVPKNRLIEDPENLLKWAANDRAIAAFKDMDGIAKSRKNLSQLIEAWLAAA